VSEVVDFMEFPHLRNAPIREAIVDLQIAPEIDFGEITKCAGALRVEFEKSQTLRRGQVSIDLSDSASPATKLQMDEDYGIRLETRDRGKVLQLRRNGFTLSYVGGYTDWGQFSQEARELWKPYGACATKGRVTRIATRFINVIKLPSIPVDLDEYLRAGPKVPRGISPEASLPDRVGSFFFRTVIPADDEGTTVIVSQALEPYSAESPSLVLDVDVFLSSDLHPEDEQLWTSLNKLRTEKNKAFFSYLTEAAIRRYL